jgi:hypothetical protein
VLRLIERVVLVVALAAAGVAVYLALDAHDAADRAQRRADGLQRQVSAFKPTLVVQQRGLPGLDGPKIAPDGQRNNITQSCADGSVVVGGGHQVTGAAEVGGSIPTGGNGGATPRGDGWMIDAYNFGTGPGRAAPQALCARGEGGLTVRSTVDVDARPQNDR